MQLLNTMKFDEKKYKIGAIIVTYNRKELLLHCLNKIVGQSFPISHIWVIDNASSDGTLTFLAQNGWKNNAHFTLLSLSENQGGAAGFYAGIENALEMGMDYLWLMDDDGFPDSNCLETLMENITENCFIGPIVLDKDKHGKLAFSLRLPNTLMVLDNYKQVQELGTKCIHNIVLPFNGTLISTKLIKKMGMPCKEYFIWGDETEYLKRAMQYKADVFTVVDSIFYHPAVSSSSKPMFFGKLRFNDTDSKLKLYCFCRNSIANYKKYSYFYMVALFAAKAVWFYSFTQPSFSKLKITVRAIWHGVCNNFKHHKDYLT